MSDMLLYDRPHNITVDEFLRMGEADVFEDRHVELSADPSLPPRD